MLTHGYSHESAYSLYRTLLQFPTVTGFGAESFCFRFSAFNFRSPYYG